MTLLFDSWSEQQILVVTCVYVGCENFYGDFDELSHIPFSITVSTAVARWSYLVPTCCSLLKLDFNCFPKFNALYLASERRNDTASVCFGDQRIAQWYLGSLVLVDFIIHFAVQVWMLLKPL